MHGMCLIKCLIETPGYVLLCLFGVWLMSGYKDRFLASLPVSRRANADFTRPVFTPAANADFTRQFFFEFLSFLRDVLSIFVG